MNHDHETKVPFRKIYKMINNSHEMAVKLYFTKQNIDDFNESQNVNHGIRVINFLKLLEQTIIKNYMNFLILQNRTVKVDRKDGRENISQIEHPSSNVSM